MKIENTSKERIVAIVEAQREFFRSGATLSYDFRKKQLCRLQKALKKWAEPLCNALWQDLHKSMEEAVLTELSIVEGEVKNHLRHLKKWMKPERRSTPLKMMPSRSRIVSEPLGQSLIISPWNYPVQLLLNPLVGAISSGCTALLKPSPYVPNVSKTIEQMIAETFDEQYVAVVQGNRDVNAALLEQRYDIIFFTGSPSLGKLVMSAAAKNLTPVVLELGGKSPCIVDKSADVEIAAQRIAWGKTLNAGQTCIAPDYLLIHHSKQERFIEEFALTASDEENICLPNIAPAPSAEHTVTPQGEFLIVDYSERAIAVFGNTRPLKAQLSAMGGRFNSHLNYEGERRAGWIFQRKCKEQLTALLGIGKE